MKPKTEVFIPYQLAGLDLKELRETLEAWDTDSYEPIAIEVKDSSNDRLIHVAAEAIAKRDYVITRLGSTPQAQHVVLKKGSIKVEACNPRVQ